MCEKRLTLLSTVNLTILRIGMGKWTAITSSKSPFLNLIILAAEGRLSRDWPGAAVRERRKEKGV